MSSTDDKRKNCLVCKADGKQSKGTLTRGLCYKHHRQYLRARAAAKDAEAFESYLISSGLLMPNKQGKRTPAGENAFEVALRELEGLSAAADHATEKATRKSATEKAGEKLEQAEKLIRKKKAKKTKRGQQGAK